MIYTEFLPEREPPIYEADWLGEFEELRQRALDALGLTIGAVGYVWSLAVLLLMHPDFAWAPLLLPLSMALLGSTLLILQQPRVRRVLFVAGVLGIGAVAVFGQRSPASPFVYVVATLAAPLASGSLAVFLSAAAGSTVVLAASRLLPGQYPASIVSGAVVLCWAAAVATWLTWRNLRTVLQWALREYEHSRQVTRELQDQRGKLNRTMKDLADANLLLKRTTHDLAQMSEEAERAGQLKSQFAANISHELRTPLHLIVGFSQMMHRSPSTYRGVTWTPELQGDVQEVYESAQQLLRLIDDVLDLSQVEAARLPISKEEADLEPLILDAIDTARSLLRDRNLYLRTALPEQLPRIHADPTRIRQVLLNLLNNASRFTEEGGITVRAVLHEDTVEVIVEDTGIGIPAEQLGLIFDEFHQVDNTLRRRYGGTGLGLSICKQFVALHDGRIWAESDIGKGSRFHFTLPLPNKVVIESQRGRRSAGWHYPAARPGAHRLVTLNQPPEFARLLRRYLTGIELVEAQDAAEAAQLAGQHQADAIVISPDIDDGRLTADLAEATADLWLPVIACSLPSNATGPWPRASATAS